MKLLEFIQKKDIKPNEFTEVDSQPSIIVKYLKKNCSEYLLQTGGKNYLYRGLRYSDKTVFVSSPRQDRTPHSMALEKFKIFNKCFKLLGFPTRDKTISVVLWR